MSWTAAIKNVNDSLGHRIGDERPARFAERRKRAVREDDMVSRLGGDEFIPIVEESGLILPIGEWVLRTAVLQMRLWQQAGLPPMSVAVNLSAVQFRQANLTQWMSRIRGGDHQPGARPGPADHRRGRRKRGATRLPVGEGL